jgi:hypothetical protein
LGNKSCVAFLQRRILRILELQSGSGFIQLGVNTLEFDGLGGSLGGSGEGLGSSFMLTIANSLISEFRVVVKSVTNRRCCGGQGRDRWPAEVTNGCNVKVGEGGSRAFASVELLRG